MKQYQSSLAFFCAFGLIPFLFTFLLFFILPFSPFKAYDKRLGFARQQNTNVKDIQPFEPNHPNVKDIQPFEPNHPVVVTIPIVPKQKNTSSELFDILNMIPDPDKSTKGLAASDKKSFSKVDSVVEYVKLKEEITLKTEPSKYIKDLHLTNKELKKLNLTLKNLDFIHIAKNAGTTMENIGRQVGRDWGITKKWKTRGRVTTDKGLSCRFPWHVPPRMFRYNAYPLDWNFCIIRHPLSRLISEFKFHTLHRGNPLDRNTYFDIAYPIGPEGLNKWIHDAFKRYNSHHGKTWGKWTHDCHLIPMTEFIMNFNGTRSCQFVLKLENIEHDFGELMNIFGFRANLTIANQSGRKTKRYDQLNRTITPDDISPENMEMLREFYKDDFRYYEDPQEFKFFDFGKLNPNPS